MTSKECGICGHYHSRIICPVCGALKVGNKYYDGHRQDGMLLVRGIPRHTNRMHLVKSSICVATDRASRLVERNG